MQPYVGQVIAVGFNFAPVGWLLCNGQLVQISEYEALYNLIGTTYGGNGQTTFGVPDLCGRSPLGQGTGPGLPTYVLGQMGGTESVSLTSAQIAAHTHPLLASSGTGTTGTPASNMALANQPGTTVKIYGPASNSLTLAPSAIGASGNNLPHENRQPFNTVNYIIAAFGVYPSQS
ncbi:MAG TPA: tail fiber protein [Rhodopila sp.]|nr:tail fiber protein [Rhodopila sp.]